MDKMIRKPTGLLDNLPVEQQEALEQWLFDDLPRLSYRQARERLQREFNVKTHHCALSLFYQRHAQERMMLRILESARGSKAMTEHFREHPSAAYDALLELLGQAAFDQQVAAEDRLSLDQLRALANVAAVGLKARRDTRRLELDEREAAAKERNATAREREVTLKETIYLDQMLEKQKRAENKGKESKAMTKEELQKMVEVANFT